MGEAMRLAGLQRRHCHDLPRGRAAEAKALIINLPGSPKGVRENLEAILKAIPHAVEKLKGDPADCAVPESSAVATQTGSDVVTG
jgi:molybdopterin biosynthesis enzyme MoaB